MCLSLNSFGGPRAISFCTLMPLTSILVLKSLGPVLISMCPILVIGYIFLQGGSDIVPPVLRPLTLDDFMKSKAKVLHIL